ncbi:MAG TPA: hypothetical protein VKP66_16235 [Steroidobacteraceae bacterium]|nr:hypothetical protein [Steroidobacteraceae bacterium]
MSTDRVVPLLQAPWRSGTGAPFPVTPLPGLQPKAIQGLKPDFPGILSTEMRSLLRTSCGLAGADLGSIDFTSRWFSEEPLSVFRPCLTLAVDDEGRRWIAETSRRAGLPGPVWCVFADPDVAVYVCDDLGAFLSRLHGRVRSGRMLRWLRKLDAEARAVWTLREILALRSQDSCRSDSAIRDWLRGIPYEAWLYDLRAPSAARGWPYGLAGPDGRLDRCGRLPVFAVAGCSQSRRTPYMPEIAGAHALRRPAMGEQRPS